MKKMMTTEAGAKPMFGYGVTKERTLSENVLQLVLRYARQRLFRWSDLGYGEDTDPHEYGVARSRYHNRISEALDCDRELVEEAFVKAAEPFGVRIEKGYVVNGTMKDDEDFTKIYDSFCDNLLEVALRENAEDRHPNRITEAQLDEIAKNPPMVMPSMCCKEKSNDGGD